MHYDRIDLSEGIDVNKGKGNKECIVCHYWYFYNGFKLQRSVCNGFHNILMVSLEINYHY